MGLITNIQELPGVTQKDHNAPFLALAARSCLLGKLENSEAPLTVQGTDAFALLNLFIRANACAFHLTLLSRLQ